MKLNRQERLKLNKDTVTAVNEACSVIKRKGKVLRKIAMKKKIVSKLN